MRFLDELLQAQSPDLPPDWKVLTQDPQLNEMLENSVQKPVALFKHSTRCGVSSMALWQLSRDWPFEPDALELWYLDILRHRALSNRIAEEAGVRHQSPQLLLFRHGKVDFHTSHHRISISTLREALLALPPQDFNASNA